MHVFDINYHELLLSSEGANNSETVAVFQWEIENAWKDRYIATTPWEANVVFLDIDGFRYPFDNCMEVQDIGEVGAADRVQDRVIGASGFSRAHNRPRPSSTLMNDYVGRTETVYDAQTDKGHFMSHASGGTYHVNLFPQSRDVNRGWSAEGKLYRAMESYAADNPGIFVFSRPVYGDRTDRPHIIEYGILRPDMTLWIEAFTNHRHTR